MAKSPQPVDVQVGRRVREQRLRRGKSQSHLAELIGVTFQQVQKYEKGTNRVGASRLSQIAIALDVPVSSFFSPGPLEEAMIGGNGKDRIPAPEIDEISAFMATRDGVELVRAFAGIRDARTRKQILHLVQTIAASPGNGSEQAA